MFLWTLRVAYGFLICFALELLEPLSTIHLLVNTDSGSSLRRTFYVLVVYTLLNLGDISCIIVGDLTITGIQEETQLVTSPYSLNSTAKLFCLKKTLFLLFLLFLFLLIQCWFSLPVCSYEVATTVCPCAPCNKYYLLI